MHRSILLIVSTLLPLVVDAQQLADGQIVPFTSKLPSCASQCGPLSDVQGACVPPVTSSASQSCFCADARLTPFLQGTSGVSSVCGAASCTATSDLQTIETWYEGYCNEKAATTTTSSSGSASTSSSSNSSSSTTHHSWLSTHYKWVIMLVFLVVGITAAWLTASFFRRRYLRKREREIEMRPPVALGPHQLQVMSGGYNSGEGVAGADGDGGHYKEAARSTVTATPAEATRGNRESKTLQKRAQ